MANPSILFPPERWRDWALTSSVSSDWIIQQRESNGSSHSDEGKSKNNQSIISSIAWIASGLSNGDSDNSSRLVMGGVVAAFISVGLYMINNENGIVEGVDTSDSPV